MPLEVTDTQVVYQRSMGSRLFCGLATPFIAALFASLPIMIAPSPDWFQERSPLDILSFLAVPIFMCLCGLAIVVAGVYGAGPEDLIIDLTTRRYQFRRGFPLLARRQNGTLDDVEALYVRAYQNKNATMYFVMLAWKGQGRQTWFPIGDGRLATRKDVTLAGAKSMEEANVQAQRLAARLKIPVEFSGSERYRQNPEQVQKRAKAMIAVGSAVAFLVLLLFSGLPLLAQYQLDIQGHTTLGAIVKRRYGKHSHIKVAYQVNGRTYQNEDEVKYTDYQTLPLQASVQVTYLPDYPKTSRTNVSNTRRSSALMLLLYGGWLLVGCLWYFFGKRRRTYATQE